MILALSFAHSVLLVSWNNPQQVLSSQQQADQQTNESARPIWIRLKTGEILTGQFVRVDTTAVEFTVRGILQAIPLDDVIAIYFIDPRQASDDQTRNQASGKGSTIDPAEIIYEPGKNGVGNIRILRSERPRYTEEAKQAGIQGVVKLEAVFRADGKVKVSRVLSGLPKGLTERAVEAAELIQFEPAKKDGKPVSVRRLLEYKFEADYSPTMSRFDFTQRDPSLMNPELIGKRDINRNDLNFYSLDAEVQIGRELAGSIDRSAKLIADPVIADYVNRIVQKLRLHSDARTPITVKVIDSADINSFVYPGGFLYVNKGLLLAAPTEAAFAGVLSHMIAHSAARHSTEMQTRTRGMDPQNIKHSDFPEDYEEEADVLGAQYLWASGYDPGRWIAFLLSLASPDRQGPGKLPKEFKSHLTNPARSKRIEAIISRMPQRSEYTINTSEFSIVRGRLGQMR